MEVWFYDKNNQLHTIIEVPPNDKALQSEIDEQVRKCPEGHRVTVQYERIP